jgi:AcrR family transcriptional regulator
MATVKGADRREEILRVATKLFDEKGYRSTSLGEIAEVIGFTKPAIYYYFPGKEDILFEIHDRIVEKALSDLQTIVDGPGDPAQKLQLALRTHLVTLFANLDAGAVFYRERGLLAAERERSIRVRERRYAELVEGIYAEGMAAGQFQELDPFVATGAILAACNWAFSWRHQRDLDDDALIAMLLKLLASGYLATAP